MQLTRYLNGTRAALGVLHCGRVIAADIALRRLAAIDGRIGPLGKLFDLACDEPKVALALGPLFLDALADAVARDDGSAVVSESGLDGLRVLPFIPDPSKVFGIGYNYKALCDHEGHEYPPAPLVFAKLPTCVIGAHEDVETPAAVAHVDFESELTVIIGRTAKRVRREEALDYVGAYTVMNELSAKILPRPSTPGKTETVPQKAVDGFAPLGSVVITPDEITDPSALTLIARVNGAERQNFPTSDMVHDTQALIAYITAIITLQPGDMIATGTSVGCGIVDRPPRLLKDGDVVECEITGYAGCKNVIRIPAQRAR